MARSSVYHYKKMSTNQKTKYQNSAHLSHFCEEKEVYEILKFSRFTIKTNARSFI